MTIGFVGIGSGCLVSPAARGGSRRARSAPFLPGTNRAAIRCKFGDGDGERSAPPLVLDALYKDVRQSVRNAMLSGLRGFRVDVYSSETSWKSSIYDEGVIMNVAANATANLFDLLSTDGHILVVSDLKQSPDQVAARFSEILTGDEWWDSRIRFEPLVTGELSSVTTPKVREEDAAVVLLAPTNMSGRSVTAHVRRVFREAGARRVVVVNQRLDTVIGMDPKGGEKRIGILPVELDRLQNAFFWESFPFALKGKNPATVEDTDLLLIVYRKFPGPYSIFRMETHDSTSMFISDVGFSEPSIRKIIETATPFLD